MVLETATFKLTCTGDTWINEGAADTNYGVDTSLQIYAENPGIEQRALFRFDIPSEGETFIDWDGNEKTIPSGFKMTDVSLRLYVEDLLPVPNTVAIQYRVTSDTFKEGYSGAAGGTKTGATWNKVDGYVDWTEDSAGGVWGGHLKINTIFTSTGALTVGFADDDVVAYYRDKFTPGATFIFGMRYTTNTIAGGSYVHIYSKDNGTGSNRPYLEIVGDYWYEPEIPEEKDEVLKVEFNPADPTQPILIWKTPKDYTLRQDNKGGFCLVKSETIIDAITDGTLIARLNQGEDYVDTGGVLATTENNLYYYKLYFCSETDYIDGTGTGLMSGLTMVGNPIPSNQAWMIRPDVASFIFTADYTPDVKEQRTGTITATVAGDFALTPTPVQHSKYQFDWKGDSTEVGWVELETPANSLAKTHYYLAYQAATSAKARIENSLGFWSDATNSDDTVTVASITPIPLINVSPKAMLHDTQETGTATGTQSASTLQDTSQTWTINEFAGKTITIHLDGAWLYEQRVISSNTVNTITIAPNWSNNPTTATTLYEIVTVFDGVLRVLGDQSYARSSNETITKYEFSVQRTSDSAYYSAAGGPPPPFWVAGATWNDLLTVPYMDITANNMGAEDTYTCLVRVTSSDFGLSSTSATTTMTVITTVPIDMKTILTSSNFAVQNMGRNRTKQKHGVIEGTSDTIIDSGIQSPSFRVSGNCYGENFQTDYDQLNTWENDDTLLKIYTDPQASTSSKFIEGWIEGLSITKRLKQNISWECNFVVKNATL